MTNVFATKALLATGWANNVRLQIGAGRIQTIEAGVPSADSSTTAGIVLPGLCNAHSHAFQRALVGRAEYRGPAGRDSFWSWRKLMYELAARIDSETLTAIAAQAYTEMVLAGYTSVAEFHYLHGGCLDTAQSRFEALRTAADLAGIRLCYVPVFYERADFDQPNLATAQTPFALPLDRFLRHAESAATATSAPHRVGIGVHSLRAASHVALDSVVDAATSLGFPMHLHIAEQPREVDSCIAHYGARPVRWLLDNYDLDERWTLVHATHTNADETSCLARSNATVCLCPSTEANLGDGLFSLRDYLDDGGSFAIGSDSHVTINPFEELRWLEYGQRLVTGERNIAAGESSRTGNTLLTGAMAGGARAISLSKRDSGRGLAVGAPADLLVLDDDDPMLAGHGAESTADALVFSGLPVPIRHVMVDGIWRVANGTHNMRARVAETYRTTLERLIPRQS